MAQQTFRVTGMHCQNCVRAITEALSSFPAVNAVSIDLNTDEPSIVRIDGDSHLSVEQVQAALSEEGEYSVVG